MRILIRPRDGIREPEITERRGPEYLRKRLEWRRSEIDALWQRLATELRLTDEARALAERQLVKMPAVGMIVIDDSVAPLERLRNMGWLTPFAERPLPRPLMLMSGSDPSAADPWHLATINKPSGLDGGPVSIGVIDFGCNPASLDLAGFAPKFKRYDDAAGGLITAAPSDGSGTALHGSKVCSMLAGSINGVAPSAMYLVAGVIAPDYETTQVMMAFALEWLFTETTGAHPDRPFGCDIISTSLHTNGYGIPDSDDVEDLLLEAEGWHTLVVAAVGNGGADNWQPPGSFSTVIAVGAVDIDRNVAWFSAYGSPTATVNKPDLLAPGFAVEFPTATGKELGEGTSFAAPIVAGAAALILQKQPNLRSDPVNFRNTLLSFVSNSTSPGTVQQGSGICDLNGL